MRRHTTAPLLNIRRSHGDSNMEVIASYISKGEQPSVTANGEKVPVDECTQVEFFTARELLHFLTKRSRRDQRILQTFVQFFTLGAPAPHQLDLIDF